jgi:3-dehydroquinate synthase
MPRSRVFAHLGGTDALMTYLGQDKKNERGELTFILTRGIGQAFVQKNVSPAAVRDFLTEMKAQHG